MLETYLPLITGSSGAIVVLVVVISMLLSGKLHSNSEFGKLEKENELLRQENNQYRFALETERKTVNEAVSAGQVTNQLITALTTIAGGGRPKLPGLAEGDLGP